MNIPLLVGAAFAIFSAYLLRHAITSYRRAKASLTFCSGRFAGLDCESRAIIGINVLGPMGISGVVCSAWTLKTRSARSQLVLLLAFAVITVVWFAHAA